MRTDGQNKNELEHYKMRGLAWDDYIELHYQHRIDLNVSPEEVGGNSKDSVFEQEADYGSNTPQYTAEEIAAIDRKLDTMTIPVFGGH